MRLPVLWLAAMSLSACAPTVQGIQAGHFVSDDAIDRVKVCRTRGDEVLEAFGAPTSRGRDNDFTVYQWVGMITASDGERAAMRSQMIGVWVDPSGRVAAIVVNPTSMPRPPAACPKGDTGATAARDDGAGASKAKSTSKSKSSTKTR